MTNWRLWRRPGGGAPTTRLAGVSSFLFSATRVLIEWDNDDITTLDDNDNDKTST
jgi:hypothetical protein